MRSDFITVCIVVIKNSHGQAVMTYFRGRARLNSEFQVSLVYKANSRTTISIQTNPVSETQRNKQNDNNNHRAANVDKNVGKDKSYSLNVEVKIGIVILKIIKGESQNS